MSGIHRGPETSLDFTPQLPLGRSTVREGFTVQKNPWWKEKPTADSQGLPLGRTHIECRDREPVFGCKTGEQLFGLGTEATVFLGE